MNDEEYMRIAFLEALKASKEDEVPVGAIIVKDGVIIGKGYNHREKGNDISSHAEIEAIKDAEAYLNNWRLDGCSLYVTLEPCLMCSGAILQARISKLVFASKDKKDGAVISNYYVFDSPSIHERPLVYFGILENECDSLLKGFFEKKRKSND